MPSWAIHTCVFLIVLVAEALLLRRAAQAASTVGTSLLAPLVSRFEQDITLNAERGLAPAWDYYHNEMDRAFEPVDEKLRGFAAAALALGLAGTLGALVASLMMAWLTGATTDPWEIVSGMGVALGGSFAGVVTHLAITLFYVPGAEDRFGKAVAEISRRLTALARENPPRDRLSHAVREELGNLRASLDSGVTAGLTAAMAGFPEVVSALGQRVDRLTDVLGEQAKESSSAAAEMRDSATHVSAAATALAPVAGTLATAVDDLRGFPDRLRESLAVNRHSWIEKLHEEQRQSRAHLQGLVDEFGRRAEAREKQLTAGVAEVRVAIGELPKHLAHSIQEGSGRLGAEFGREARDHVADLTALVTREREELLARIEGHAREWRSNISAVVDDVVADLSDETRNRLSEPLTSAVSRLGVEVARLDQGLEELRRGRASWTEAQQDAVAGWQQAAERIEGAAEHLTGWEVNLASTGEALTDAASAIERVAVISGQFEEQLRHALVAVTERYLDDLRSLHEEVVGIARAVGEQQPKIGEVLEGQSQYIHKLVQELMTDWTEVDSETQVEVPA